MKLRTLGWQLQCHRMLGRQRNCPPARQHHCRANDRGDLTTVTSGYNLAACRCGPEGGYKLFVYWRVAMKSRSSMMCVCLFAVAACLAMAAQASAEIVTFADEAAYNASTTGNTAITNWGATNGGYGAVGGSGFTAWPSPFGVGCVLFYSSQLYVSADGFSNKNGCPSIQAVTFDDSANATIWPSYDSTTVTSLGMYLYGNGNPAMNIVGAVDAGASESQVYTFTIPCPASGATPVFLGIASTDPSLYIDSVVLGAGSSSVYMPVIGKMEYGTYTAPEPSALVLLATGLFGLLAYAWRKRK